MILVVNANTNDCKIYQYEKHPAQLVLIKEISHPECKLKSGDLTADREGHYKANQSARGAYSPSTTAKEVEIINFSKEIAQDLNQRRNQNELENLILIATPHMYGLLLQHLNKHVISLVINHIQKDLLHMKDHELLDFLNKNTKFATGGN
jgi:protein required for attachment to host cells